MPNLVNPPTSPSPRPPGFDRRYVLLTAAYNEQSFIAETIQSVVNQTLLPEKWVITSDGSTDRTDEIVHNYTKRYDFIQAVRVERVQSRGVGSKVSALKRGATELQNIAFNFIGNLDADVSVEPDYFE